MELLWSLIEKFANVRKDNQKLKKYLILSLKEKSIEKLSVGQNGFASG